MIPQIQFADSHHSRVTGRSEVVIYPEKYITYSEFHNDRFYTPMVGDITMYISIIANVREHPIMNHINIFPFYSQYQYNNPPCSII